MAGILGLTLGGLGLGDAGPTSTGSALVGLAPTNLGPLTTTFTPPPACTVAVAQDDGARFGQSCDGLKGAADAASCWPPTSKGAPSPSDAFQGWGYYSPGIECPAGHATACSATGGAGGSSGWQVQFKLQDGETAVGCCPSGFACANMGGQTCVQVATKTTVSTVSCQLGSSADFGFMKVPDTAASISALTMLAPMIQINFQSSDLPKTTPTGSPKPKTSLVLDTDPAPGPSGFATGDLPVAQQPRPTAAANQGASPFDQNASSDTKTSSIPAGAIIGVGVAAGAALLTITIAGCFIWQRRIRRQRDAKDAALQKLDSMYEAGKPRGPSDDAYLSRYAVRDGPGRIRGAQVFSMHPSQRTPAQLAGGPGGERMYRAYQP